MRGPALCRSHKTHLLNAVLHRADQGHARFHVPGHKGRYDGEHDQLVALLRRQGLGADLTELPGLDNLADPQGVLRDAQAAAASVFGAARTFFLVNGSTVGIQAAVVACCPPGTCLLFPRNAHSSVFHACVVAGCSAALIQPEVDEAFGVAHGVTAGQVDDALRQLAARGEDVGAVLITSPTYFGVCSDVVAIAAVCREHGVALVVDEAHGAHLGLHPAFPRSALQSGADVAVQSTHKVLGAMTQAAMLHVSAAAAPSLAPAVARGLQLLHTSSPSYVLMASLDAAAHEAAHAAAFESALECAERVRAAARRAALPTLDEALSGSASAAAADPLRVTLLAAAWGVPGPALLDALDAEGVAAELATERTVVLALGVGSTPSHADACQRALERVHACVVRPGANLAARFASRSEATGAAAAAEAARRVLDAAVEVVDVRGAFFARHERVAVSEALGRRSACVVSLYPPGIPVLFMGELVTQAKLDVLLGGVAGGATAVGFQPDEGTLQVVV